MADVATLWAVLRQGRPANIRLVDPSTRDIIEVPVDPSHVRWQPGTTWIPVRESIASRVAQLLTLRDEDRVALDQLIGSMVSECAITTVGDDVLEAALAHIADRGFTLVRETKR